MNLLEIQQYKSNPEYWKTSTLGKEINISCGRRLHFSKRKDKQEDEVQFPVEGAGRTIGYTRERIEGILPKVIVLGRAGTIGNPRLVERECFVLDTAFWITAKHNNNMDFLYLLLSTIPWKQYSHGSVMDGLRKSTIAKIPCSIPPLEKQCEIAEKVGELIYNMQQLEDVYKEQVRSVQNLQRSLLQRVFNPSCDYLASLATSNEG